MKICVLQPDYSTTNVDYKNWDPPRALAHLLPDDTVDHVLVNKLTAFKQLKDLSKQGYDCFVNLIDAYPEWEVPSFELIHILERLNLPYSGPTPAIFHVPKDVMKYVSYAVGVKTPRHVVVEKPEDVEAAFRELRFPMFVKPAHAGDSLGVDEDSLVRNRRALRKKVAATLTEWPELLIEEYVEGREFTVLVAANVDTPGTCRSFRPIEYVFPQGGAAFKTYAFKTSELHPDANIPVSDPDLARALQDAAEKIFNGFDAVGYARMDFRQNDRGELYFLEVNFSCSIFYAEGLEGSADHILKHDGIGQAGFLRHIIAEGMARYRRKQRPYLLKGNATSGYGIFANRALLPGDVISRGETRTHRLVTRDFVMANWTEDQQELFRRYAWPVSNEVYAIWDEDPLQWAPQNHSCEPNTGFNGLNVVALAPIAVGAELTIDYAELLNEEGEPFQCRCGAETCRGLVQGTAGNALGRSSVIG